jgi:hypothetical protein
VIFNRYTFFYGFCCFGAGVCAMLHYWASLCFFAGLIFLIPEKAAVEKSQPDGAQNPGEAKK